jgi:hypothetical protein
MLANGLQRIAHVRYGAQQFQVFAYPEDLRQTFDDNRLRFAGKYCESIHQSSLNVG